MNDQAHVFYFGEGSGGGSGPSCRSVRPSFRDTLAKAREQIAVGTGRYGRNEGQAAELAAIIAEVYLMDPETPINISGDRLDGYVVQQVFCEITTAHAELVIDNFNRATYLIKNKRLYLRTALYNSVFELEAHYANLVAHDMAAEKSGGKI